MSTATSKIAAALVAFQRQMPRVSKDKTARVPTKNGGEYTYSYADLASVSDAALPILNELGVSFVCSPRRCDDGSYELVGILLHESGDSIDGALPIFGRDPQAIGSAVSYGRRYLLGLLTGIVTEDDDDAARATRPAEGRPQRTRTERPPTPEERLSASRAAAWSAFRSRYPDASQDDFVSAVEQHTAQPFADTEPEQFDGFATAHSTVAAGGGEEA